MVCPQTVGFEVSITKIPGSLANTEFNICQVVIEEVKGPTDPDAQLIRSDFDCVLPDGSNMKINLTGEEIDENGMGDVCEAAIDIPKPISAVKDAGWEASDYINATFGTIGIAILLAGAKTHIRRPRHN